MNTRGFDAEAGAPNDGGYYFDLEEVRDMADLDVTACKPDNIPLRMLDYACALDDLAGHLSAGDHGCTLNDLLHLRSRIMRCQRDLTRYGQRYGFHTRTVKWFLRDDS